MKKILSVVLAITMLMSLCTAFSVSYAAETEEDGTVYYYNDFNTAEDLNDFTVSQVPEGYMPEIKDGVLYFGVGTGEGAHILSASPLVNLSSEATAPELVLEMRVKTLFGQTGYLSTWRGNTGNYKLKTVMLANDGTIYRSHNDQSEIGKYEEAVWNTITIVYGNDSANPTRTIYLNGTKVADVSGNESDGYSANVYASTKKLTLDLLPYVTESSDYIQIDYIKISEKTESMSVKLLSGTPEYAVVKFSSTPLKVSEENFSFSDGAAIASIDKINETTYRIMRNEETTEEYSVNVSNVTDTLGLSLSDATLTVKGLSLSEASEYVYGNYQFGDNADEEIAALQAQTSLAGRTLADANVSAANGALTLTSTAKGGSTYLAVPQVNGTDVNADLVLEYKIKMNGNKKQQLKDHSYKNAQDMYTAFIAENAVRWSSTDVALSSSSYSMYDWNTISIIFDGTKASKSMYVNGEYGGTYDAEAGETGYSYWSNDAKNKALFVFRYYTPLATDTIDFDYIKTYSPASGFNGEILNNEATELNELTLDFSGTAMNVSAANIRVNGKIPAKVEVADEAEQTYKVTLSETLKPGTEYKVSLNGIYNTLGQTTYDVLSFTTRALEANEIYYDISGSGSVETAEGEAVKTNTLAEAESVSLTVKAVKGYDAVVKVNGEVVEAVAYGKYVVNASEGAYVDIDFVAVETEAAPSFVSVPYAFVEGNRSYTFARLNKALANGSFGMIASKDKNEPTLGDVDGEATFRFSAINGSNRYGEFGIGIVDNSEVKKLGSTYYVRPYATIGDNIVYGAVITVDTSSAE